MNRNPHEIYVCAIAPLDFLMAQTAEQQIAKSNGAHHCQKAAVLLSLGCAINPFLMAH
jgi:hypothetical protein